MKLQFWSFDVIFAIVIFSFAVLILAVVWYNINTQFSLAYSYGVQNIEGQLQGLDNRILYPGTPANWDQLVNATDSSTWNNMSFGLGTGQGNNLSVSKMMALLSMSNANYQSTKAPLGISYDYYITITAPSVSLHIGSNPSSKNATSIQVSNKAIEINGRPGSMQLIVWTNSTFGVG